MLIEKPDPELLERLLAVDSRVRYFSTVSPKTFSDEGGLVEKTIQELYDEVMGDEQRYKTRAWAYDFFVFEDLIPKLAEEYKGQLPLGIRGITVSIGDSMQLEDGTTVLSLPEVLSQGTEIPQANSTLIATFDGDEIHHRVLQYMLQSSSDLRSSADAGQRHLLFPAILFYDLKKLTPGVSLYTAVLPKSEQERKNAIVGVHILDYLPEINEL